MSVEALWMPLKTLDISKFHFYSSKLNNFCPPWSHQKTYRFSNDFSGNSSYLIQPNFFNTRTKSWLCEGLLDTFIMLFFITFFRYGVFPGPYFPVIGLITEINSVNLRIQSNYGKIQTRKTHVLRHFQIVIMINFAHTFSTNGNTLKSLKMMS